MATPSKRRKTNKHIDSPQTVRSLDHFFGNQQRIGSQSATQHLGDGVDDITHKENPDEDLRLNDEQLARKLQEEWDTEARDHGANKSESQLSTTQQDWKKQETSFKAEDETKGSNKELHLSQSHEKNHKASAIQEGAGLNPKNTLSLQSAASAEDAISSAVPFDESPLTFVPSKYLPDLQKHWATHGGEASYGLLTRCFILVNSTQSRIKIVDTLVNFLRTIIEGDPDSLLPAVWLATNAISPPYISLELGLGGSAISKALKNMCGLDNAALKTLYDKHGDAGDVAFEAKKRQSFTLRKPKPLSIKGVFQ